MPIKNPYGVAESGEDFVEANGRCGCCGLLFSYRRHRRDAPRTTCDSCTGHLPVAGESEEVGWRRAAEHEPRLRQWLAAVSSKADEMQAKLGRQNGQVVSALQSRDHWRDKVNAVEMLHSGESGGCICGSTEVPCPTARRLP